MNSTCCVFVIRLYSCKIHSNLVFCIFGIALLTSISIGGEIQRLMGLMKTLTQTLTYKGEGVRQKLRYSSVLHIKHLFFTLMSECKWKLGDVKLCESRSFYKVSSTSNNYSLLCPLKWYWKSLWTLCIY